MRPINLEMTAFGSYAEKTTVPFHSLKHGLYLVTGDTGAGKSTIFDAIIFALYGVASRSEKKPEMLHSDFVSKAVDTIVKLRFEQGGKEYTVQRTIHYRKKQKAIDEYSDEPIVKAVLWESDREPIEGASKVSSRCEEILGLNEDQFRKIVMLAQGEFRAFLKANSDKKGEILGKLFDNSIYIWYRNLLEGARKTLELNRQTFQDQECNAMESLFEIPEKMQAEEQVLYTPFHPDLLENLASLIGKEDDDLKSLREKKKEIDGRIIKLSEEKGAAEGINSQLKELEERIEHEKELARKKQQMSDQKETADRVEKAFHKALPAINNFNNAERELQRCKDNIESLKKDRDTYEKAVKRANTLVDADKEADKELKGIALQISRISDQIPRYRELDDKKEQKEKAEAEAGDAKKSREEKVESLTQKKGEISALEDKINETDKIDVEAESLKRRLNDIHDLQETLLGKQRIKDTVGDIRRLEDELKKEKTELLRLTEKASDASEKSQDIYKRFLSGQAGILAEDLQLKLNETGTAICPVCGSVLSSNHIHQFAPLPENTPKQEDFESAKENAERTEKKRSYQDSKVTGLSERVRERKDGLIKSVSDWLSSLQTLVLEPDLVSDTIWMEPFPEDTEEAWSRISTDSLLEEAGHYLESIEKKTDSLFRAAEETKKKREYNIRILPKWKNEVEIIEREIKAYEKKEQEQLQAAEKFRVLEEEIKKQLEFDTKGLAKRKLEDLKQRKKILQDQIEDHKKDLETALQHFNNCDGQLKSENGRLPNLEQGKNSAETSLRNILIETGFENSAQVHEVLALAGEDAETWLKEMNESWNAYKNDCENTSKRIQDLKEKTKGKSYKNLEELKNALENKSNISQEIDIQIGQQRSLLKNHRTVLEKCQSARDELASTEDAWNRLDKLANLAVGTSGEGGILSFDRYVMGAVFREVLEMANRRMDSMSGGKYELIHKVGADRQNSKAGLDIEILDNSTGQSRASDSLSGGEAFFTSLALALGLSDVVQNHAGGKQMDALFIDEGFGSLSEDVLEKALEVLGQLAEGNRLVGIISHVDRLDESISQKIRVKNGRNGSHISLELS